MILGLMGRKLGMGRMVDSNGVVVSATLLSVGPCFVTQVKTAERDGYRAIQIGYEESTKLSKPQLGHVGAVGKLRHLREVPFDADADPASLAVGEKFDVSVFVADEKVDVVGVSKGRGFAGTIKRHGFHGGPKTHGQSDRWRAPGAIGAGTTPGRVYKGTRMSGRMGGDVVTTKRLQVLAVDAEKALVAVKGAVPGPTGGLIFVKKSRPTGRRKR
ncbi:MAG: 50S ribosomal protein L3 [Chloroflexi bacterium]|nr:50S ribosomal protein L3 [Chloroflexota bacterium]